MSWTVGTVTVLVLFASYLAWFVLVLRPRLRGQPRGRPMADRLRSLGLGVLLLPLAAYLADARSETTSALALLTPAVALALWTFAPRYVTTKALPLALVAVGVEGLDIVRDTARGGAWPQHYGFSTFIGRDHPDYILLQAVSFIAMGLWLTIRSMNPQSRATRLLLREPSLVPGRPGRPRWGLLLPVVVALGIEMLGWTFWLDTRWWTLTQTAVVALAALFVTARYPAIAGDLALAGLVLFGLYGVALGVFWPTHVPLPSPYTSYVRYGAILVTSRSWALAAGVQGLGLIGLGLWLTPRALDSRTRALFRSAADAELAGRVVRLTRTREDAVDTATMQLRRLERDLHDGAQARLVALGMSLRAVERLIYTDQRAAAALVTEARESSAKVLDELRGLVRGICPPVLADRGLPDAVRALALDAPLHTEVTVDLPGRAPLTVETACYFAVAEVLANTVKHSGARSAQIRIWHADGTLKITVVDDGTGGADPRRGTGLVGLERRLGMFDGVLAVNSPIGGPTIIAIEVPCAIKGDAHRNVRARAAAGQS